MNELRKIVAAASTAPWEREPATDSIYAHQHMPAWVVADVLDNDEADSTYIATFDPELVGALLDVADEARSFAAAHDGHDSECDRCRFARLVQTLDALTERP